MSKHERPDYVGKLLEEAAAVRRAGNTAEWITSQYLAGLIYKEAADGRAVTIQYRDATAEELEHADAELICGLSIQGQTLELEPRKEKTLLFCCLRGKWLHVNLSRARLIDCTFSNFEAEQLSLVRSHLHECDLSGAKIRHWYVAGAMFEDCDLRGLGCEELVGGSRNNGARPGYLCTRFLNTRFDGALFQRGNLPNAQLQGCELEGVQLGRLALDRVSFAYSGLTRANLEQTSVTRKTSFSDVLSTEGCRISRENLDALRDFGGLSLAQRRAMHIADPYAEVRNMFGGFLGNVHLLALCLFLLPYVAFAIKQYWISTAIGCSGDCETILRSLACFIYGGGAPSRQFSWSFVLFLLLTTYNLARGLLLLKTKRLELAAAVTGIPPRFSLGGHWGRLLVIARVGFWINLVALGLHVLHFMQRAVPVP